MRCISHLGLAVLLTNIASGQAQAPRPSFDIADVHVSPRSTWVKKFNNSFQGGWLNGDRYQLRRATLLDLIKTAYAVDADKVYGGPNWLDYDRFEVVGKAPPGTRVETLRLMLQSLLADRFKLVVRTETKPVPAYVLTATKGRSKLKAADGSGASGCTLRMVTVGSLPSQVVECRNVTMDLFASELRRFAGEQMNNLPVANQTGLDGTWDLNVQYTPWVNGRSFGGTSIEEAVDKQLGLTLKLGTAPQPVLAVESARQPSANPAGVTNALPPLPDPQFEVASVRPCKREGSSLIAPHFEAGGRVTAPCYPLLWLIQQAWDLRPEEIAGVPKWLSDAPVDMAVSIVAKAPAGNFMGVQGAQDNDALKAMMRRLLLDRYKMKVHFEDRPKDALTLTAGKPKLTKADPSKRTGCTRLELPGVTFRLVCQNITLAQFAEQIPSYDGTILYPVLDATGIQGAWDFTLDYRIRVNWSAPVGAQASGATPREAAVPSGGLSLSEAIDKQLGLKVVTSKRPEPVLVIDHMETKLGEN